LWEVAELFRELSLGLKVSYGIFFNAGAKVPTAINVQPASGVQTETAQGMKNKDWTGAGGI
jgi:hypothetical protein